MGNPSSVAAIASAKSTKPSNSQPPPQCLNFQVGPYYGVWLIRISLRLSLYGFAVGPIGGKPLDRAVADSFIARTITGSRLNVRGTPIGPRSGPDVKKPLKRDLFQGPENKFPPRFEDFIRCVRIKFAELDLRVYVFFIA